MRHAENGDVIKVARWSFLWWHWYTHWGIYVLTPEGEERVIHYTGPDGPSDFKGIVRETSLEEFLDGASDYSVWEPDPDKYGRIYSGTETVERARHKLKEKGYNLLWNNCEHFAVWCKTGKKKSHQVSRAVKGLEIGGATLALLVGVGVAMQGMDKI